MLNKHIVGLWWYSYPEFFRATSILQRVQEQILNGIWKSQISHFLFSVWFGEKCEHQLWPVTKERLARWLLRKGVWLLKKIHMRSVSIFFFCRIFSLQHMMLSCDYEKYQDQSQSHHAEDSKTGREKSWESEAELVLKVSYLKTSPNAEMNAVV